MKFAVIILLLRLFALVPFSLARRIGRCLGNLCWLFNTRMAQTTRTNLALCFPDRDEKERNKLGRESLQHTFQAILETGAVWLWPYPKTLHLILAVEGLDLLHAAKAAGKGVIVMSPHIGNWEILGLYLATCECGPTSQLYQALESKSLDALIHTARSRSGAQMVATDNKGIGVLLRTLRNGEIVGILPDQVPAENGGEFAPFFNTPTLTMSLLNRLQQKTGAEIIVGRAVRTKRDNKEGFIIRFNSPEPSIYAEHMSEALAGLNHTIEKMIADNPEQYGWEYKRFKRQPQGMKRIY
ncbi:MAG: lysophospholipid acyltransferase family protein [Pseudomonadota bacterium]